jgi:hypothetical protein
MGGAEMGLIVRWHIFLLLTPLSSIAKKQQRIPSMKVK